MEEILIEIKKIIKSKTFQKNEENITEKHLEYEVYLNDDIKFSLTGDNVDEIIGVIEPAGLDKTIVPFKSCIEKINTSFLEELSLKFCDNPNKLFVINIRSEEDKIFILPWEILKMNYIESYNKHLNVIIKRTKGECLEVDIDPLKTIFCSSIDNPKNCTDDISNHLLTEAMKFKEIFKEKASVYPDMDKGQKDSYLNSFDGDIVHLAGHGDITGMIIRDGEMLRKEELSSVKSKLIFLNFCQSGTNTLVTDSIVSYLFKNNNNLHYIIGMRNKVKSKYALDFSINFYENIKTNRNVIKSFAYANKNTSFSEGHEFLNVVLYQK